MLGEMVFTKGTTAQSAANMSDTDDRAWKQWKADTDARAVERYRALSSSGALAGDFPKGDAVVSDPMVRVQETKRLTGRTRWVRVTGGR